MHYCKECGTRIVKLPEGRPKVYQIINIILFHFDTNIEWVSKKDRKKRRVYIRYFIFYFLKKYTSLSYKGMGEIFGGMDHSTVMWGIESIQNRIDTGYDETLNDVDEIDNTLLTLVDNHQQITEEQGTISD